MEKVNRVVDSMSTRRTWTKVVSKGIVVQAYDLLRSVGGLTNDEMARAFLDWNEVWL